MIGPVMKGLAVFVAVILILTLLSFFGAQMGLWHMEFFGKKRANIEREIFDNTKSQVQGTIQVLNDYRLQYKTADNDGHRGALREAILQEYMAFARKDLLPGELLDFIKSIE